jgi:hypothetical protein
MRPMNDTNYQGLLILASREFYERSCLQQLGPLSALLCPLASQSGGCRVSQMEVA